MNPDSKPDSISWYYYSTEGAVSGPVPFEELTSLVESGTLSDESLVVPEGAGEDWKSYKEWTAPTSPPPLPETPSIPPPLPSTPKPAGTKRISPVERAKALQEQAASDQAKKEDDAGKAGCLGCGVLLVILLLCGFGVKSCFFDGDPSATVQRLVKSVYGSNLRDTSVTEISDNGPANGRLEINVRVNASVEVTNNEWVMETDMVEAFKTLYTSGLPIWKVTIWNHGDGHGNASNDARYIVSLDSRDASKVDWENTNTSTLKDHWREEYVHDVRRK